MRFVFVILLVFNICFVNLYLNYIFNAYAPYSRHHFPAIIVTSNSARTSPKQVRRFSLKFGRVPPSHQLSLLPFRFLPSLISPKSSYGVLIARISGPGLSVGR